MQQELHFLNQLVHKGGPERYDYTELQNNLHSLSQSLKSIPKSTVLDIASTVMNKAFSLDTMQGFAFKKPHGYAGDFEIIERIYSRHISSGLTISKWDEFFHDSPAAKAVINRKTYFKNMLESLASKKRYASVLNVASGPARDLFEYYLENPYSQITIDCVDHDPKAIEFASKRCYRNLNKIKFHNKNALRFKHKEKFDLVWSAGLFDYFNDATFVKALKHLAKFGSDEAELVVGNFCNSNPAQAYMDLFDWKLQHRSAEKLIELAMKAGFERKYIEIKKEPEGVNLFLHIQL